MEIESLKSTLEELELDTSLDFVLPRQSFQLFMDTYTKIRVHQIAAKCKVRHVEDNDLKLKHLFIGNVFQQIIYTA